MKKDSNIEEVEDKKKKQFLGNLSDTELALFLVTLFLILVCSFVINTKGEAELHGHETIRNDTETVVDNNSNNNQEVDENKNNIGIVKRNIKFDIYNEADIDYDIDELEKILDDFGFTEIFYLNDLILSYSHLDTYKAILAFNKVQNFKKMSCSNIYAAEESRKLKEDNGCLVEGQHVVCCDDDGTTPYVVSYDDVNSIYQKMFGENIPKKSVDDLYGYSYDYVDSISSFMSMSGLSYDWYGDFYRINVIKAAWEEDNYLYIEVYYLSGNVYGGDDIPLTLSNGEVISTGTGNVEEFQNIVKEKYLDQIDEYEILFEKNGDDYILKSVIKK